MEDRPDDVNIPAAAARETPAERARARLVFSGSEDERAVALKLWLLPGGWAGQPSSDPACGNDSSSLLPPSRVIRRPPRRGRWWSALLPTRKQDRMLLLLDRYYVEQTHGHTVGSSSQKSKHVGMVRTRERSSLRLSDELRVGIINREPN